MSGIDPSAPAWILDVAETVLSDRRSRLSDAMLERDEDITDNELWALRRRQLDEALLAAPEFVMRLRQSRKGDRP